MIILVDIDQFTLVKSISSRLNSYKTVAITYFYEYNIPVNVYSVNKISREICNMIQLVRLDLSYICVKVVPRGVLNIRGLCVLSLNNSFTQVFEFDVGESLLKRIEILNNHKLFLACKSGGNACIRNKIGNELKIVR